MKLDHHSQEKYIDFLKDVKDLIQNHVSELKTHDVTEITKTMLKTVCDPLCKFLHPNEFTRQFWWWFAWSHPECWRGWHFPWVSTWYIDWWSVTNNIILFWAHGTITHQSHSSNMKCKEASPHNAIGSFQSSPIDDPPHHHNKRTTILIRQTWPSPKKPAFRYIVPDSEKAHDLPIPVHILATVVAYSMKIKFGIKVLITSEAASYQVPEKKFWTCVKGVKYDSGTQKARQSGKITLKLSKRSRKQDKESSSATQSSSSEEEDIFAKVQPLQRKRKHGKRQWKSGQWHTYWISPKSTSQHYHPPGPLHLHFLTIKPCHIPNLPFLANLQSFQSAIKI